MAMEPGIDGIAVINPSKESWCIEARILRLWEIPNFVASKLPYSIEMGDKIHASVRKSLIFKFNKLLEEGDAYRISFFGVGLNSGDFKTSKHENRLNFEHGTNVKKLRSSPIPSHSFDFVKAEDLLAKDFDNTFLVDVIGMLRGVGVEREIEREIERDGKATKYVIIELYMEGHKLPCTFFGPYVDRLNALCCCHCSVCKSEEFQGQGVSTECHV